MQSRRDQVDAQRYLLTRLSAALVRADPDTLDPLGRRDVRGLVGGTVLAAVVLGVVALWALISGSGSTEWRNPRTLIIEKGTGSRFLLLDGELRPVPNIASARLLTGGVVTPQVVPASRLKGTPRGTPIGIDGGPDLLPAAGALNRGVWRVCSGPGSGAGPAAVLDIGVAAAPQPDRPGTREALLVSAGGSTHLIWRGQRLRLTRPWVADVLGFGDVRPTPVDPVWLALVPAGPELGPPAVDGRGSPGWAISGRPSRVGDLFTSVIDGGTTTRYMMLSGGLAVLTPVQFALARAEAGGTPPQELTPADLASGPRSMVPAPWDALPAQPPVVRYLMPDQAVCVESGGAAPRAPLDVVTAPTPPVPGSVTDRGVAVRVAAGGGALVIAQPVPPGATGLDAVTGVFVDGSGTAYPLSGRAMRALGYSAGQAVASPWQLLPLLPVGPRLTVPAEDTTAESPEGTTAGSAQGTTTASAEGTGPEAAQHPPAAGSVAAPGSAARSITSPPVS
ncbi:type VII secretion protein EccB [Parafrankia irregularis]|uniref:Type VII secretion protein EccB n=1 Tax=Parafrankia irregularis TaxID=795642 RepID=A0A0S4QLC5_9ACTN|nr:type VII secretion protein EccB [Parafrankia irregularis]CUU56041.1 type VII secretion protein EccB [Parafrankia irregularis]